MSSIKFLETKEVIRLLEKRGKNLRYFAQHENELRIKYANKYVAILNCKIVDYDDDLSILNERLGKNYKEADINFISIHYVHKEKDNLLFKKVMAS